MSVSFANFIRAALELLFYDACSVCGSEILDRMEFDSDHNSEKNICARCNPSNTLLAHHNILKSAFCFCCGESIFAAVQTICENCRLYPLPCNSVRSLWSYTEGIEELIKALKYQKKRELSKYFAYQMYRAIASGSFPPEVRYRWNLVLPLPSTLESLKLRGFSPMGEITAIISKKLKLNYSLLALEAIGKHPPQASLSLQDRLLHIGRKFSADRNRVSGKNILLLDDVITSGASICGATMALMKQGAQSVDVLSLARSDLFSTSRFALNEKFPVR